jgi:replicative DNA helicase
MSDDLGMRSFDERDFATGPPPPEVDAEVARLKVPPHSREAEQAVIGGLLLDNGAWDKVSERIVEGDFYRKDHQLIFRAINALVEQSQPFDVVTLSEWLSPRNELGDAGGLAYLGDLAANTPSAANIAAYADIVHERSVLRDLIRTGNEIAGGAFNPEGRTARELLEDAEKMVFQIAERGRGDGEGFAAIKDVLVTVMERIDELYQRGEALTGVGSGFRELDERTSGMQPGDLIIVAGRPSMGKTSFAMNIVENAAVGAGVPVAVFSMEMPAESLTMRMLSSLGRVDQLKVRTGKLHDDDWPRLTSALTMLNDTQIFIDDTPALSPTEMRSRCRRLKREHGLGLVVVDYLQLMQVAGTSENRTNEISEISRSLKALAKELSVPVIALSQLNRSLEQRQDKRPVMSDLRESGAIEQDADVILFIYRDEVYNDNSADRGMAEIIIAKQRNGPIGRLKLTFLGHITKFENFAPDTISDHYLA